LENTTGYVAALSTSFSELFLLKAAHGGLVIRGDLADPTVLRIPAIPSIGSTSHQMIAVTPLGTVFITSQTGAWLWSGGESVEHISADAVDGPDFIVPQATSADPSGNELNAFVGRIWCWQDYVFFPNNWVWNWRQNNWWRLENPADIKFLFCGPDMGDYYNRCYFSPSSARVGTPAIYEYDSQTPAKSYIWTSQPLPILDERQFKIREVVFVVAGVCDWIFELFNLDGTSEQHTFSTNRTDRPQYIRRNANVTCEDLRFRIWSTSTTAAGVVYEVRFGIQEDVHYPSS
jgi:hypothetical protein